MAIEESMIPVLLGIVESNTLLQVGARFDCLTKPKQGFPQCPVAWAQECRVVLRLGQSEELLSHNACLP